MVDTVLGNLVGLVEVLIVVFIYDKSSSFFAEENSLVQVWSQENDKGSADDDGSPLESKRSVSFLVVLIPVFLNRVHDGFAGLLSLFLGVGGLCLAGTWWWRSGLGNATRVFERLSAAR